MKLFKKKRVRDLKDRRIYRKMNRMTPAKTGWVFVNFEINRPEADLKILYNVPEKTVNRVMRTVFKKWRKEYRL